MSKAEWMDALRKRVAERKAKLAFFEKHDARFAHAEGNAPLVDYTDELLADLRQEIATYEKIIAQYEHGPDVAD